MINIFYYFNKMNFFSKITFIILIFLIVVLIVCVILLLLQNKKDNIKQANLEFLKNLNDNKEKNKDMVIKVNEEVKKNLENAEKFDISSITKQMEQDIEKNNIELTDYEVEQEEKAIISYKELLNKVKEKNNDDKIKVNLQTVSLKEKEEYNDFNTSTEILDFSDIINDTKFKNSPFVSPVDGIQDNENEILKQENIKSILDIDEIDKDIMGCDEFLDALKELRDSLL